MLTFFQPDAVPCALNVTALLIVLGVGAMQSIINILLGLVSNPTSLQ